MKQITLKTLYEKVTNLQRDIAQIKKTLIEEPELREDFILRMQNIDLEKSTLRLPSINAGACSGLTLSGASLPRLQRRGLARPNGSIPVEDFGKRYRLK